MGAPVIYVLATSLSGSQHIVTGGVRDRQNHPWTTEEEARAHLARIGWTDVRVAILVEESQDTRIITWDDQSKTQHVTGSGHFEYLRGGPPAGRKISKSEAVQ